ncbi:MAG: class I SAM-dependent methyltransferase [Thiotrichales bacterium]|nr:class I SAM-dependent methyltransferase [Thiotrichales bacterium]
MNKYNDFYDSQDRENIYSSGTSTEMHGFTDVLEGIKTTLQVDHPKVLEIGAGNGRFQNIFDNYTGSDITENTRKFFHKNYIVIKDKERYPFKNEEFDLIFTNAVFEHIPDIDTALKEMIRVTKYGGVIVFNPAWQCRPWAANGYQGRPYSDFNFSLKLIH